jgi:hypothetical protein
MLTSLQAFQEIVGPLAAFLIPLTIGFLGGAVLPRVLMRHLPAKPAAAPASVDLAQGLPPTNQVSRCGDAQPNSDMALVWETQDTRRTPRRGGKIVEVLVAPPGETETPRRGLVLNRSNGGLGVLVREEYPVGSMIGVMPAEASKLTPWVEAEVKSCRKNPDGFEVGLQFLMVPPYSVLVMFG